MIGGSDSDKEGRTVGWEGVVMPSPLMYMSLIVQYPFSLTLKGRRVAKFTSHDSYRIFPMWNCNKVELMKTMIFIDKLQL